MSVTSSPVADSGASQTAPPAQQARSLRNLWATWRSWTATIFALREDQLFLLLAVLIGIFSGLAVVCFRIAIEWVHLILLGSSISPPMLRVLLVPAIGGLVVALLVIHVFPGARGSGVNQTKAAVYISNGYVSFNTVVGKFIICALGIGTGQSLGPEDPSLQIGAGIASLLGRRLNLSQEKIRLIAPVGAAAGLAAAFNAPISSVIFVIEEVIGTWSAGVLGAIVLAAISSVVTMRSFMGPESLFRVPSFRVASAAELLAYAVLGVIGGCASLLFLKWLAYARPRIQNWPRWTQYFQPAAAGLVIGFIGIRLPQVMGAGYSVIDQALHGQFSWKLLLVLAALKIFATGISFLSGTPGGMFAPTLFIGAMLGGAVGSIEHHLFPSLSGTVSTYALVGMGVFFAGFLRTPITSVFMVIEVSGSYTAILPIMIANMVAYLISRTYQKAPLFDLLARQDGLVLPSIEEQREQVPLTVEVAMLADGAVVTLPDELAADLAARADAKKDAPILLRVGSAEWLLLDREEIQRIAADGSLNSKAAQAKPRGPLPLLFRDQSLEDALHAVGDWPAIPVVNRADLSKLEGVVTLAEILRAFRNASVD
ncbi:MAG: chloride channel protein [Candidatus Acidiferrales bacterium]